MADSRQCEKRAAKKTGWKIQTTHLVANDTPQALLALRFSFLAFCVYFSVLLIIKEKL